VHLAPWATGSNLAVHVNRGIDDRSGIQQEAICYKWFKKRLILSVSKPSISRRSQIKEDTVEPSVPAREFSLKACAAITWHNDWASLGHEPRLADHRSQAARTATLPKAPSRQAFFDVKYLENGTRWAEVLSLTDDRSLTRLNKLCYFQWPWMTMTHNPDF